VPKGSHHHAVLLYNEKALCGHLQGSRGTICLSIMFGLQVLVAGDQPRSEELANDETAVMN
jgi:hypothetical protein